MNAFSFATIGKSLIGASLLAAAPALASEPAQGQAALGIGTKIAVSEEGGKAAAKADPRQCRRVDAPASRVNALRACHTKQEWNKIYNDEF
jgi:hypothetical protein